MAVKLRPSAVSMLMRKRDSSLTVSKPMAHLGGETMAKQQHKLVTCVIEGGSQPRLIVSVCTINIHSVITRLRGIVPFIAVSCYC